MTDLGNILIRGVNWLGDALMSVPALERLREAHPHACITMLTPEKLADFWRLLPVADRVIPIVPGASPRAVSRDIRPLNVDAALILPNSPRAALECWLAKIPRRIGYAAKWRRLFLTQALPPRPGHTPMNKYSPTEIQQRLRKNTKLPEYPPKAHHIHHYLHLAAALEANPEPFPIFLHVHAARIHEFKGDFQIQKDIPLLALVPGAEYGPAKRWPAEHFAFVAKALHKKHGAHALLLGGPGDQAITGEIFAQLPAGTCTDLAGKTTLGDLAAALAASRCVLANDSGPMHLAAAVQTPTIALFGSTSPELTTPGIPTDRHIQILRQPPPCAPCFLRQCPIDLRCLQAISPEEAIAALEPYLINSFPATPSTPPD